MVNLKTLPNFPALSSLYNQYHLGREGIAWDGSPHVSSHWKIYGNSSRITIDSEGHLIDIQGMGFGSYRHERLLKRMVDYAVCGVHFLIANPKGELFTLTRMANSLVKRIPWGRHYVSHDLFCQIHALATIKKYIPMRREDEFSIVVIGDGFGFLSALLKVVFPRARILLVDIGRTLLYQCLYLQFLFPECGHELIRHAFDQKRFAMKDFVFCPAEHLHHLTDFRFNLAINICSMQEMAFSEVQRYFTFLRNHSDKGALFYCCNRESKVLPDGEKIEFHAYPWLETDTHLIDGYPSVYKFWFSKESNNNSKKKQGLRFPFIGGPDGPIRHRLTLLSSMLRF